LKERPNMLAWRRVLAGLVLAAVGLTLPPVGAASAADVAEWGDALMPAPNAPLLALPNAAGRIIGVAEKRTASFLRQTLALAADPSTPGQNEIVVTLSQGGLARRIVESQVLAEMAARLPGIPMSIAGTGGRNALGVFGYAVGGRGSLACLYAWQGIDNADRLIDGSEPGWFSQRHSLSIRVRLCRERMSPRQLVSLMQGLGTTGSGGGMAGAGVGLGDALSASTGVVEMDGLDATIVPDLTVGLNPAAEPRPNAVRPARKGRAGHKPVQPADTRPAPLAGMPTVPMPD
jgi:hypothetical protein